MQDVDTPQSESTGYNDDANSNVTPASGSTSASYVPNPGNTNVAFGPVSVQPEPEAPSKSKSRSRISTALRKLSNSTRKKDKVAPKETAHEGDITSGGEETATEPTLTTSVTESKSKKKSQLAKRFLLGGLKKSKPTTKIADTEESIRNTLEESEQLQSGEESGGPDSIVLDAETAINVSQQRLDRVSKVQITISGKKIEHKQVTATGSSSATTAEIAASPTETDYLTPSEDLHQVTGSASPTLSKAPSSPTRTDSVKTKKKKLKTKKTATAVGDILSSGTSQTPTKIPTSVSKSASTTGTVRAQAKQKTETLPPSVSVASAAVKTTPTLAVTRAKTTTKTFTTNEEKFVITESNRDTPPPERAPAKPSRIAVTVTSQTVKTNESVHNLRPTTRAAATVTTPRRLKDDSGTAKSGASTPSTDITATRLMQNPKGTPQRGHRFPKPSTLTPVSSSIPQGSSKQSSPSVTASPNEQEQRQLKFQRLLPTSKASISLPPTPPQEQQQPQSLQSIASNDLLLQLPTYPPPPIPSSGSAYATPETRSPVHQQQQHLSYSAVVAGDLQLEEELLAIEKSVADRSGREPDDIVSSAESVHQSASDALSTQAPTTLRGKRVDESAQPAVEFEVGSAVRRQDTQQVGVTYDIHSSDDDLDADVDVDVDVDEDDTNSPSPNETSRKRIRYVAQPTLLEELNSLERRRVAFKYQSGISVYTLDSEDEFVVESPMPAFGDLTMEEMEPTIMSTTTTEKSEHLYKILVIGELGTGKTSFIKRYVHQFFTQNYRATIGVDFALKVLHWDPNTIVRLQLWDIAGQERFGNMTRVYYKEAVGAFIVFDVTRSATFDCVSKWKEDLDSKVQLPDGNPIPCILLANKCDQEKQGIVTSPEKMDEYVKENGFAGWFETSAKENINIDDAARALVNKILLNDKLISAADLADSEKFNLNSTADQTANESKSSKCSC